MIKKIKQWCEELQTMIGDYCMKYPHKAEEIIKRGIEIKNIYTEYRQDFLHAVSATKEGESNIQFWELTRLNKFVEITTELYEKFITLYKLAREGEEY